MKTSWLRNLILVMLLICGGAARFRPAAAQEEGGFHFRVSTSLIQVPIAVFDQRGLLVGDLRKEDFRLWEDKESQEIRSVGIDTNAMSVVLVLDTSSSSKSELKKVKAAAELFASAVKSQDQISIITFDDEVNLVLDWTGDRRKIKKALGRIKTGYRTALYDAMYLAASEQLSRARGDSQKAIILLTDCLNNQSRVSFDEAARAVARSNASFYVVSKTAIVRKDARLTRKFMILNDIYQKLFGDNQGYVDEYFTKRENEMVSLAEQTGGSVFFPADFDAIRDVYQNIALELKNKYYLTYVSNQTLEPDSQHRIAVEYLRPASALRYRRNYYYRPQTPRKALAPAFASSR